MKWALSVLEERARAMWHQGFPSFTHMVAKLPSKGPVFAAPVTNALFKGTDPPGPVGSQPRTRTTREAIQYPESPRKQASLPFPWRLRHPGPAFCIFTLSFPTAQGLFRQHGFVFSKHKCVYLYLPTTNTPYRTEAHWEGELFIKHTHTQILLTRN